MNEEQRIKMLEEELKILKNEVKTILLDIREQYLNIQNPFNVNMMPNSAPPAGANPDQKERELELSPEELNIKDDFNTAPIVDEIDPNLSFGKPFPDLSTKAEADMSGFSAPTGELPGMGPVDEPGPSAGPGPSGKPESDDLMDTEEEQPPQKKRGKKKVIQPVEMELESDAENDTDNGQDDLVNTKLVSPKNGKKKPGNLIISGTRADLVIIAGLTQWVDQVVGKLGKDRAEALVEMSTAMGRIPENIKDVLIRMIRISRYESTSLQSPTATDYLATLAQLESLMGGEQIQDNALLSILSMMKESNRG
jgi:hypothetical protein